MNRHISDMEHVLKSSLLCILSMAKSAQAARKQIVTKVTNGVVKQAQFEGWHNHKQAIITTNQLGPQKI